MEEKSIANAADDAVKVIAHAADEASKVIACAAAEALKVSNIIRDTDHDLLIELKTRMEGLRNDIKDLNDGTTLKIENHEVRLGKLETARTSQSVLISIGIAILSVLVSLLIYHIVGR
jgi:hypothetical protein